MHKSYTLIELLIVIGVLAVLTGLSSLSMVSFSKSTDTETAQTVVRGALNEARANSMALIDNQTWGVHLEINKVVVFPDAGGGYNPGNPANSTRLLSAKTKISWSLGGASNVEFSKRTGKTNIEGTITISGESKDSKTISINTEGMIE